MRRPADDRLPSQPLVFQPLFLERVWGGRKLETLYRKALPPGARIGESWEIVDRPEAQSIVREGAWAGRTLHELWQQHRRAIFGALPEAPRFPLLIKLLDAEEKLSLQVHPPAQVAAELGGEAKTEFWYIAAAETSAELYLGLKRDASRENFEQALRDGGVESLVHRLPVRAGDAMFLPSGRLHAIGAGNVIVEIQQNSDTTYRVFDWNREDAGGRARPLHIKESLHSIAFDDFEPELITPSGETLLRHSLFQVERWELDEPREACGPGTFAIIGCLTGAIDCAGVMIEPGEFFLVPACLKDRVLRPGTPETSLLRVMVAGEATLLSPES